MKKKKPNYFLLTVKKYFPLLRGLFFSLKVAQKIQVLPLLLGFTYMFSFDDLFQKPHTQGGPSVTLTSVQPYLVQVSTALFFP